MGRITVQAIVFCLLCCSLSASDYLLDDFNDNEIDATNWVVVGAAVEQSDTMQVTGVSGWNVRGVIWQTAFVNTSGNYVSFDVTPSGTSTFTVGLTGSASTLDNTVNGAHIYFNESGSIIRRSDAAVIGSWVSGVTYTVKFTCTGIGAFDVVIDGGDYTYQSLGAMNASNTNYFQLNTHHGVGVIDNLESNTMGNDAGGGDPDPDLTEYEDQLTALNAISADVASLRSVIEDQQTANEEINPRLQQLEVVGMLLLGMCAFRLIILGHHSRRAF